MIRFLIALPAAALLAGLSYWSVVARPVEPEDRVASGLALERSRDLAGAERELLAAADRDHLYEPRWTLAGFYFRHDRADEFWIWARKALDVGPHDLGGLFDLCWQVTGDAATIWQRAMPDRKEIWNEYLGYLMASQRWEAAGDTAGRLASRSTVEDLPMLLAFCDLAIEKNYRTDAVPVWNSLCERRLIGSTAVGRGHYLVNGDLARRPIGRGFDWRLPAVTGVRAEWTPGELHVAFSGNQVDHADVAVQALAVPAGGLYRFTYRYRTQGIAGDGLRWRILRDGVSVGESTLPSTDSEKPGVLEFSGGAAMLALTCEHGCAGSAVLRAMDIVRE